jgi:hypothetical protein
MLYSIKTLKGYKLAGLDGEIGKVKEFYFDDRHWTIRYLVADTGSWLTNRQVLISPHALHNVIKDEKDLSVSLTREQIENSPSLETHKPVSLQFENDYHGYFGWPTYWNGVSAWGDYPYIKRENNSARSTSETKTWDHHLRSTNAVTGYGIQALDDEIGHVEDFVIDDETWAVRYFVVATKNWWPGKKVLVSPQWIQRVSWSESMVSINLSCDAIKNSPEFTEASLITRDYEIGLHRHYQRKGYWIDELAAV